MKKTILISMIVFLSAISMVFGQDISVNTNRRSVGINESFSIEFSSDQKINGQPDFSSLQKDFEILSTRQGHSKSIINGHVKQQTSWVLEVVPKREGELIIPAIFFGKSSSSPFRIEVTSAHSAEKDETIFLEAEVSPKNSVYEQTQLIFTLRLYRSVNIVQGNLTDIQINDSDAIVERLGNDVEHEHFHSNGRRYVVLERKYGILPQHAGELIISPVAFEGKVVTGGNSYFNVQTQFKRVFSNQERVEVKSIPPPFQKNNWLAAYDVKLEEEWSTDPSLFTVGEPVTWTLKVMADGSAGNLLPPVSINLPPELKQYVDKPLIENQSKGERNIGIRQTKIALIASKAGEIMLPEIVIPWWDLKEEKIKEARLPARTIQIEPPQVAMNDSSQTTDIKEQPVQTVSVESASLPIWAWILIGLNSIWIIGLGLMLVRKINIRLPKLSQRSRIKSELKRACQANDAKQAEACLLAWAALVYPHLKIRSIIELKEYVAEEPIEDLYRTLYGHKKNWKGDALWEAIASFKPEKGSKKGPLKRIKF